MVTVKNGVIKPKSVDEIVPLFYIKIRQAIAKHRLKYYEVAKEIGISPFTLSVWLREELAPEREKLVMKAIDEASKVLGG